MHKDLEVGTSFQSRGECGRGKQGLSCSAESEKSRVQETRQVATSTPNLDRGPRSCLLP